MKNNLNPQQKQAAEAPYGPLLIVAGAGTGKTRTLTSRLAYFVEQGMLPHRICAITFTNKAAKEMAGRVATTTDDKQLTTDDERNKSGWSNVRSQMSNVGAPFIGTFHALGARILRAEARMLGRKSNFLIFDDHDSFDLVKKITKQFFPPARRSLDEGGPARKSPGEESRAIKLKREKESPSFFSQKISEIKNKSAMLGELKISLKPVDEMVLKIFERYEEDLKENNAFDFDDLIEKPVSLFKKYPEIREKYQRKFDAVLVDEYQDVSPIQYEFVKILSSGHKNLSAVGDDEQLIYGWRYANLGIFLNFEKDWPGAAVAFLEENYRSTANIVSAAQSVAENNQYRRPKNLLTKNPAGAPIKIVEAADEDEEAEWIASRIAATIDNQQLTTDNKDNKSGRLNVNGQTSDVRCSSAVLYRTNAQSRAIEQALIRQQIPYQIFGGLKFYERKEIKDIVAALRYFANRSDSLSRERLEKNFGKNRFLDLAEEFVSIEKGGKKNASPTKLIEIVLKTTDYLGYIERNFMNYSERHENIGELVGFASRFDNLQRFLEEIALVQATDIPTNNLQLTTDNEKQKGRSSVSGQMSTVHLSTIHLAKGLEFDRVFIAGTSEGLLPHGRSMDNDEQMEEERRLMYVAMTRAKKELSISFYDLPSRFISEIPQEFIEFENASEKFSSRFDDEEKFISLPE